MQPEIEPYLGPKSRQRPARTLLWYLLSIAVVYIVLFETVGMKTALLFLGSGKAYNEVLISFRELSRDIPKDQKRIFFLGDSTVAILDDEVALPASLQQELKRESPEHHVQVVDWAFGGASMFHYYCLAWKAQDYSPSMIIFPINYRTYGPEWQDGVRDEKGELHGRELVVLTPFRQDLSEKLTSPLVLEKITVSERLKLELDFWEIYRIRGIKIWLKDTFDRLLFDKTSLEDAWSEANVERRNKAHHLVVRLSNLELTPEKLRTFYPMKIRRDNPEMLALQALTDMLRRQGIPFIAYLTPMNIQQLRKYDVFDDEAFRSTVRYIEQIVTSQGGAFLDLSNLLESEEFMDRLEHYKPEGANKVAHRLVPAVKDMLRNNEGSSKIVGEEHP